jgi:hypothetical protein
MAEEKTPGLEALIALMRSQTQRLMIIGQSARRMWQLGTDQIEVPPRFNSSGGEQREIQQSSFD